LSAQVYVAHAVTGVVTEVFGKIVTTVAVLSDDSTPPTTWLA